MCTYASDGRVQWSSCGVCGGGGVFRRGQGVGGGLPLQLFHPPLELRSEDQQLLQALVDWHLQQHLIQSVCENPLSCTQLQELVD